MNADQGITTLEQLDAAARARRSVVIPSSRSLRGPMPAAFVINMAGPILLRLMRDGMFVYLAAKKRRGGTRER